MDCTVYKGVFVTSTDSNAILGGLAGADQHCQMLAADAKIPGTFKAWLSSNATSADKRLTHATIPYRLLNGDMIAKDWGALVDGSLDVEIIIQEDGNKASANPADSCPGAVWTNTGTDGSIYDDAATKDAACWNWTSDTAPNPALVGDCTASDSGWSKACELKCGEPARLYCFQQ